MFRFAICVFCGTFVSLIQAEEVPASRVLWIGLDGCRPDALLKAETPHLDSLKKTGAWSYATKIQGKRYQKSDTSSGPGWSSFLTGVWADKHGVNDNSFEGRQYDKYPHVFQRIKERWPTAFTASFVDWEPIDKYIVESCDLKVCYPAHGTDQYAANDVLLARAAAECLREQNPSAMMVYFGAIDETGHASGFHPDNSDYIAAIQTVDERVGEVLTALQSRNKFDSEKWLVIVSTDHGGKGKAHGGGQNEPEIVTTFMIISGEGVQPGKIAQQTYLVDVPATGLAYLGLNIDPAWKLDGKPVGLNLDVSP
ncbi:MAG: alkaline phosphatase family protein [Fuerstiella sp.]